MPAVPSSVSWRTREADLVASGGSRMLGSNGICRRTASSAITYVLAEQCREDRVAVERFIGERFAATYGAQVSTFMPRLFALRSAKDKMVGAFGLRLASQRVFLERYLDHPVEAVLGEALGVSVERQQIVEVGHFAGSVAGAARAMIIQLTARLHREGFRWVLFTGTARLRNAFHRLGLHTFDIATADPARLDWHERARWGSYYQHMPRVQFGDIAEGFSALSCTALSGSRSSWKPQG
jgi:Thermostable hemolysin